MEKQKIIGLALAAKIGWDSFCDSDSSGSDDEKQKNSNPKNMLFFENTVCKLNDAQFKSHFRILPSTFELLYQNILFIDSKYIDLSRGQPRVTLEKQLLMTLWYLANTECFRSVADRFGVSIYACWKALFDICQQILKINLEKKIITWPPRERLRHIANNFLEKTKFPGIIGCIDGSHIAIPAPKFYHNSYVNRKKFHSVLLQAVCDDRACFTDCYAGEAGSIHDSCLFRRSNLYRKISNGCIIIPPDYHMVGDLGYALKPYLMTPFKDTGRLSAAQTVYNKAHSSARIVIERAFGLLKGRFRRLNRLTIRRPDYIPLIIMASCILHNICIQHGDNLQEDEIIISNDDGSTDPTSAQGNTDANLKRNNILRILNL